MQNNWVFIASVGLIHLIEMEELQRKGNLKSNWRWHFEKNSGLWILPGAESLPKFFSYVHSAISKSHALIHMHQDSLFGNENEVLSLSFSELRNHRRASERSPGLKLRPDQFHDQFHSKVWSVWYLCSSNVVQVCFYQWGPS